MKLFLLIPSIFCGYKLRGCYSDKPVTLSPTNLTDLTVDNCATTCILQKFSFAMIGLSACFCSNELNMSLQNSAECNTFCRDSAPCGGNAGRFSVYDLFPIESVSTSPTPSIPPTVTSLGQGDSVNQRQVAIYASTAAAVIIVIVLVVVFVKRRQRMNAIPTLPRLKTTNHVEYVLPGLLPVSTSLIYSCYSPYTPERPDEIALAVDDVVAVLQWESDGWAKGTNVTTGAKGMFPLICLVSLETVKTVVIPPRGSK